MDPWHKFGLALANIDIGFMAGRPQSWETKALVMGDKEFENFTKHEERKQVKEEDHVDQPTKRQLHQGLY